MDLVVVARHVLALGVEPQVLGVHRSRGRRRRCACPPRRPARSGPSEGSRRPCSRPGTRDPCRASPRTAPPRSAGSRADGRRGSTRAGRAAGRSRQGPRRRPGCRSEMPPAIERVLVAEVAVMGAAARDHDRVRAEVAASVDEVPPDRWRVGQRALPRDVPARRPGRRGSRRGTPGQVSSPGPMKIVSACGGGLVGHRRDVQPAEGDVDAARTVSIGDLVGPLGRRDVHRHHDEVGLVVERERLDVLVLERWPRRRGRGSRRAPPARAAGTART